MGNTPTKITIGEVIIKEDACKQPPRPTMDCSKCGTMTTVETHEKLGMCLSCDIAKIRGMQQI